MNTRTTKPAAKTTSTEDIFTQRVSEIQAKLKSLDRSDETAQKKLEVNAAERAELTRELLEIPSKYHPDVPVRQRPTRTRTQKSSISSTPRGAKVREALGTAASATGSVVRRVGGGSIFAAIVVGGLIGFVAGWGLSLVAALISAPIFIGIAIWVATTLLGGVIAYNTTTKPREQAS